MSYYAITVNKDNYVTGVHICSTPFVEHHFEENPEFANDRIIPIDRQIDGIMGLPIEALNDDYTPKPTEWLIENGYRDCPTGYELIDGQLVEVQAPAVEAPETIAQKMQEVDILKERLATAESEKAMLEAKVNALITENELYGDLIQELALVAYK